MGQPNPFEFGRALSPREIVDRDAEVAEVHRVLDEGGRLFLIGPRRYGKTSILRAAADASRASGTVVLHYNAEAYPALALLARAIVADAAGALVPTMKKVVQKVQQAFGALRPQLTYNPLDNTFSATLGAASGSEPGEALLVEALDGLDRLAAVSGKRVGLILDEFQQVVEAGGVSAEGQVRAAVQRHDHVAYVFAGSKTALLAEMTCNPDRPFYRLGARLFVGSVPRVDFRPFLQQGLEKSGHAVRSEALEAILDEAHDVPYNVQRLAHACFETLRGTPASADATDADAASADAVDAPDVRRVLDALVARDDPFYTQMWNGLTSSQQKALLALAETEGTGLYAKDVLRRYGLGLSTMRRSLDALVRTGIAREDEVRGAKAYRLEDPFFARWLTLFVAAL